MDNDQQREILSAIAARLTDTRQTVATAESCTGGLLSGAFTSVAGSSAYFNLGVTTYSNQAKAAVLGVDKISLETYGAVSSQVAKEMAVGIRSLAEADFALSVTGVAGPGGGTAEKPVGLVYIGLADRSGVEAVKNVFSGNRVEVRRQTVDKALNMLWERLLFIPSGN